MILLYGLYSSLSTNHKPFVKMVEEFANVEIERNGSSQIIFCSGKCRIDGNNGRIALRRAGKVYCTFAQRYAGLRHADGMDCLECRIGKKKRIRVREADILGSQDAHAAGDEKRVFSAIEHTRHPIHCRIGIRTSHALDKCGNNVVMHLSVFVIDGDIVLQTFGNSLIVNDDRVLPKGGIDNDFKYVEQLSRIASTLAEQGIRLNHLNIPLAQYDIFPDGTVEEFLKVFNLQRLKHKDLAAREQGSYDLERRVLGGRADKNKSPCFNGPQKSILLAFVKTVNFIDEQHRRGGMGEQRFGSGRINDISDILYAGADGRESKEIPFESI